MISFLRSIAAAAVIAISVALSSSPADAIWLASTASYSAGAVPGTIQAEDFDRYYDATSTNDGGQYRSTAVDIKTSSDAGGGYAVGWMMTGEWLEYDVNIATAGAYTFAARVASAESGRSFHLEVDRVNVTGSITVPNTGAWNTSWTTVSKLVTLPAGAHKLRIHVDSQYLDFNAFSLTALTTTSSSGGTTSSSSSSGGGTTTSSSSSGGTTTSSSGGTTTSSSGGTTTSSSGGTTTSSSGGTTTSSSSSGGTSPAAAVPGTIQAENFVRYYDLSAANLGGAYRSTSVDIKPTNDTGGGYAIGWMQTGEWLEYDVNIATAGTYAFSARVASAETGRSLRMELDRVDVTGPVTIPTTGPWNTNWTTVALSKLLTLPAGRHTLRIIVNAQYFDLNSFTLTGVTGGGTPSDCLTQ